MSLFVLVWFSCILIICSNALPSDGSYMPNQAPAMAWGEPGASQNMTRAPWNTAPNVSFGGPTQFRGSHGISGHDHAGHASGHDLGGRYVCPNGHTHSHPSDSDNEDPEQGSSSQMHQIDQVAYEHQIVQGQGYQHHDAAFHLRSASSLSSSSSTRITPKLTPDLTPSPTVDPVALVPRRPKRKATAAPGGGISRAPKALKEELKEGEAPQEADERNAQGYITSSFKNPPEGHPRLTDAEVTARTLAAYPEQTLLLVNDPKCEMRCRWAPPVLDDNGIPKIDKSGNPLVTRCPKVGKPSEIMQHMETSHPILKDGNRTYCCWSEPTVNGHRGPFFCGTSLVSGSFQTHMQDKHFHDTNVFCTVCGKAMTRMPSRSDKTRCHLHADHPTRGLWNAPRSSPATRNMKDKLFDDAPSLYKALAHLLPDALERMKIAAAAEAEAKSKD